MSIMALRAREGSLSLMGRKVLAMINRTPVHVFDGAFDGALLGPSLDFASNNCVSLPTWPSSFHLIPRLVASTNSYP